MSLILSRASLNDTESEIFELESTYHINSVISNLPISEQRMKQFQLETANDNILQQVRLYTHMGWPADVSAIDPLVKAFYNIRD